MVANPLAWVSDVTPEAGVRALLTHIGEDPNRDGLKDTPARVAKALREMTAGYAIDVEAILSKQFDNDEKYGGIILLRRVPFASLCEHHMLPFTGHADVAYIPFPGSKIVGLSKLARVVDAYAKRLQVQERMTTQIADALCEHLQTVAVGVVIRADHTCMALRGIEKMAGGMLTSEMRGIFKDDPRARGELMELIA